jgi:hypothetical protein
VLRPVSVVEPDRRLRIVRNLAGAQALRCHAGTLSVAA